MSILYNKGAMNKDFTHEEQLIAIEAFYDRRLPVTVILWLYGIFGVFGNTIVILVYWKEKRMSSTHFLLFNIAIIDWTTAIVCVPLNVVYNQYWPQIINFDFCKAYWSLNNALLSPGIYLLVCVSFVRYIHVSHPHKMYLVNKYFLKPSMVTVFLMTFFVTTLAAFIVGKSTNKDNTLPFCNISDENRGTIFHTFYLVFYTLTYILCLTAILVLNIIILRRMIIQRQIMTSHKNESKKKQNRLIGLIEKSIISEHESILTKGSDGQDSRNSSLAGNETLEEDGVGKEETQSVKSNGDKRSVPEQLPEDGHYVIKRSNSYESRGRSSLLSKTSTAIGIKTKNKITDEVDTEPMKAEISSAKIKKDSSRKRSELEIDRPTVENAGCCKGFQLYFKLEGLDRTTLKLTIVSFVYVICYFPFFIVNFYTNSGDSTLSRKLYHDQYKYIFLPLTYTPFLGCAANPIIYTFVDPKFRNQCKALFGK